MICLDALRSRALYAAAVQPEPLHSISMRYEKQFWPIICCFGAMMIRRHGTILISAADLWMNDYEGIKRKKGSVRQSVIGCWLSSGSRVRLSLPLSLSTGVHAAGDCWWKWKDATHGFRRDRRFANAEIKCQHLTFDIIPLLQFCKVSRALRYQFQFISILFLFLLQFVRKSAERRVKIDTTGWTERGARRSMHFIVNYSEITNALWGRMCLRAIHLNALSIRWERIRYGIPRHRDRFCPTVSSIRYQIFQRIVCVSGFTVALFLSHYCWMRASAS